MRSLPPYVHRITTIVGIIMLTVFLVSCGSNATSKANTPIHRRTPISAPSGYVVDAYSLHVQSVDGLICGKKTLVLATSRLTYDSGEIQQIKAYVLAYSDQKTLPPLPSTLTFIPVQEYNHQCYVTLQITNVGKESVQLPKADILVTTITPSYEQYRLIDTCNVVSYCPDGGAGGGQCGGYFASITLSSDAQAGVAYSAPLVLSADQNGAYCGDPVIEPGQSDEVNIDVDFGVFPNHVSYVIVPELTLNTSSGTHLLSLNEMKATQTFTSPNQFICYGLQNNTFFLEGSNYTDGSHGPDCV